MKIKCSNKIFKIKYLLFNPKKLISKLATREKNNNLKKLWKSSHIKSKN